MPRSGEHTRERILEHATQVASSEGLDGLTIGSLAAAVGVSKGAVANHFSSKEELQLHTVRTAAEVLDRMIMQPARHAEPGLPRLVAILEAWLDYLADPPFEGGCFFCTTTTEYGVRDGAVHDTLATVARLGLDALAEQVRLAQRLGELDSGPPAEQFVFELHAFLQEANWSRRLHDDPTAIERARTAIHHRLNLEEDK